MIRKLAAVVIIIGVVVAAAFLIPHWCKPASHSADENPASIAAQKGNAGNQSEAGLAAKTRLASDSRSSDSRTRDADDLSGATESASSSTLAGEFGEEPIWFLDIAPVEPGDYPYWLIRDDVQITDPLNAANVNPLDKRSILHYPISVPAITSGTLSPQNAGNKKARFLYKGRLDRSLLFISDFRGDWWGIDEFKPQNAAAQANWQEILKDPKLGSISGVVMDPNRRPIGGARVRAVKGWTHLRTVECDREGRFRIDRLQPGDITLNGRAFSYKESDGQAAVILAKTTASPIEIVLKPTSVVMGKVTDASGKPIPNAEIVAASKTAKGYGFMGMLGPSARTDAAGIYSHGYLNDGKYEFLAKAKDYAQAVRLDIQVGVGQPRQQVDFILNEGAHQPGTVVQKINDKDEPAPGATIQLFGKAMDDNGKVAELAKFTLTATSGKDGSFTALHVPFNTDIRCWAEAQDMDPIDREMASMDSDFNKKVAIKLAKGSTPAPITLHLPETGVIFGKVIDPEKKPVEGASVALVEATITPIVPVTRPIEEKQSKSQKTNAAGEFKIKGLSKKNSYVLRAEAPEYAASFTDQITPGDNGIEIMLGRGGALKGKVVHGDTKQPVVGVSLKIIMENSSRAFIQEALSGPDGTFRYSNIPVGQYRIGGRGLPGNTKDPMVVQPQLNIPVEEGREGDVTLLAWPGLAIRGFVRDSASKAPVAKANIAAKWQSSSGAFTDFSGGNWMAELIQSSMPFGNSKSDLSSLGVVGNATSDDKGAFEIISVAFGKWELAAKSDKYMDTALTIEIPKNQNMENVELLMASGGTIKGIVLDVAGKPIPKIQIMAQAMPSLTNMMNFQNQRRQIAAGDDGRFVLSGLPLGKYMVMAISAPDNQLQADPVELTFWKPNAEITIQEKKGGISGKVTDAEGNPIESAILIAMSAKNMMRPGGQAITDQDGHYNMKNVPAGEYTIRMMRGMAFTGETKKVTLVEGQPLENVDFVLGLGKSMTGLVVDLNAKPMSGWTIQAIAQTATAGGMDDILNSSMNIQSTGSDGKFKLGGLKEGKYYLQIMQINSNMMGQMVFKSDTFDLSDEEQIFILPVGGEVRGRLVADTNKTPIPVASFYLELKNKYNKMQPRGKLCTSQGYMQQKQSQTLSDGRFQFAMLPIGTYDLQVGSDQYGNKQIEKIEVSSDAPVDLGDIALFQGKTLTGRLIDGSNGTPYIVGKSIMPGMQQLGLQAFATRTSGGETRLEMKSEGSDGRFRIDGAPADISSLIIYSPDHLLLELPSLPASQTDTINLGDVRLPAGETLECTVTDANGQPAPLAMVIAVCEGKKLPAGVDLDIENAQVNSFFKFSMPFGNDNGKMVIKGLYPGAAYLKVFEPASNKTLIERQNITIKPGGPNVANIQLPATPIK